MAESSFPGPLPYRTDTENRTPGAAIDPGESMLLVTKTESSMTPEQIEGLTNKSRMFFFFGRGEYEDENRKKYPIRFCFMYDEDFPGFLIRCQTRYLPREDDPNKYCPNPN
jgi:hypothetical protein